MRGKEGSTTIYQGALGITPAYAGKRSRRRPTWRGWRDHPRVCGEKILSDSSEQAEGGSPPRMRGKGRPRRDKNGQRGITPAYAGKRSGLPKRSMTVRDHPRVCGEKAVQKDDELGPAGSPPRMRGKVWRRTVRTVGTRITPAYAGKRASCRTRRPNGRDHPRVCGEKVTVSSSPLGALGSPPRMRGKAVGPVPLVVRTGITPAYAGKSGPPRSA